MSLRQGWNPDPSGLVPLMNVVGWLLKSRPFLFLLRLPLLAWRRCHTRRGRRSRKRSRAWLAALSLLTSGPSGTSPLAAIVRYPDLILVAFGTIRIRCALTDGRACHGVLSAIVLATAEARSAKPGLRVTASPPPRVCRIAHKASALNPGVPSPYSKPDLPAARPCGRSDKPPGSSSRS